MYVRFRTKERTSHGLKRKEWVKGEEGKGEREEGGGRKKERRKRRRNREAHHHILTPMPRACPDGIFSDTSYLLTLTTLSLTGEG